MDFAMDLPLTDGFAVDPGFRDGKADWAAPRAATAARRLRKQCARPAALDQRTLGIPHCDY